MKNILLLVALTLLVSGTSIGQKISSETINFEYKRLPLKPFDSAVETYNIVCVNIHAESVEIMRAQYEAEKDEAKAEVEGEHQAVKIINSIQGNSTKVRFVEKPYMPKIYDGPVVANKLTLENLEKAENAEVTINLEMLGMSHTKTLMTSGGEGAKTYYYKVGAKHEMKLTTKSPDGTVLTEIAVPGSDKNIYASTKKFSSTDALNSYWAKSKYDVLLPLDSKISEANFKKANQALNSFHGTSTIKKPFKIAVISDKKMDYDKYAKAYELMFEGALYYVEDEPKANALYQQAIDLWEAELKESDVKNKKARINEKVTGATRYNCIIALTWARKFNEANSHYVKLKMLDMGKYNRQMPILKAFIDDQEARYSANN
ncbi:MAG: hypothetical protein ACPGEG_06400 [Salibacteraceae bacterium]